MAMKKEKPLSKEEIISEFLGEIIREAGVELGFYEPKSLPSGANNSPVKSY